MTKAKTRKRRTCNKCVWIFESYDALDNYIKRCICPWNPSVDRGRKVCKYYSEKDVDN